MSLIGYVSDESYVALADVALEFAGATGQSWETRSRASGAVHAELPPGDYLVTLHKPAYGGKRVRLPLPGREVVLNVHVTDDAINGEDGTHLARVENTRSFVSVDQVRTWCGTPGTTITVRPVLDLNEHLSGTAYETPDRLVEQSALVDETCVFPWCSRPARRTDCDHVVPPADDGWTRATVRRIPGIVKSSIDILNSRRGWSKCRNQP